MLILEMKTRISIVLWWLPFLFYAFLLVNTQRMEDKEMETKVTGCDLESRPTFHHAKKITGDAQEAQVECDDNSIYIGKQPSATCTNGIWHTQGECRQYFWHNPPIKTTFFLTWPLTTASRRSLCIRLTPTHASTFQVSVESEDRMTAIVIRVEYEMLIRGDPLPRGQGIHIHTRDTRDPDDDRKNGILVKSSAFVVDSMVQLRLTPANIRTLVISVGSEKLITYEAATRIDLLKSVHINGAVSVNEVDSLCHTCDVKASPQFSDVEVTWQNGSWPLVGNVTCKEEGFTWKAISASHAMCFADIWSLSGECEEQTIQNPTVGKVYLLRRNPLVGHTLSIKGIPSANTSFSLALTKGNDAPVVFIFQFQSQKIIGKSKIMKGDSKKTFYRVFPLIVGQPFAIIMTIIKMDEVAVQVDSLREPLHFQSTALLVSPLGVQGFSARGDVIITELNLNKQ